MSILFTQQKNRDLFGCESGHEFHERKVVSIRVPVLPCASCSFFFRLAAVGMNHGHCTHNLFYLCVVMVVFQDVLIWQF